MTIPKELIPSIIPIYRGRLCIGAAPAIIVMEPFIRPEEPMPATARPTIRASEVGATPHMSEPSSKTKRKTRKVYYPVLASDQVVL
jgi:hypothetical protein